MDVVAEPAITIDADSLGGTPVLKPSAIKTIWGAIEDFIRLSLMTLVVPFTVITDLVIIGNRLGEMSVTEWTQVLFLSIATILFADAARQEPRARGFYVLCAGFFLCAIIRELDLVLDKLVFHGAWVHLAVVAFLATVAVAVRFRQTVLQPAADFIGTRSFLLIQSGLILVLILSRTLGSGGLLWNMLGYDDTHRLFKTIIQESLELYGYILICCGALTLRKSPQNDHSLATRT